MSCDVKHPVQKGELSFDPPHLFFFSANTLYLTSPTGRKKRNMQKKSRNAPPQCHDSRKVRRSKKTWRTTDIDQQERVPCRRHDDPGTDAGAGIFGTQPPPPTHGWMDGPPGLPYWESMCVDHLEGAAFRVTRKLPSKITQLWPCVLAECMSRYIGAQSNQGNSTCTERVKGSISQLAE